jgi:hypothetical protein
MVVYFLVAVWVLAMVPAVVGHRRAHRADALVSFAAFQARGRMLATPVETGPTLAARRQRVAGVFLVALTMAAVTAIIVPSTWSTALVAAVLQASLLWYAAVVRAQVARS